MTVSRDLALARYERMLWNTPLAVQHADLLLDRLDTPPGGSVLDFGCGWGELLLRAIATVRPSAGVPATGVGVDNDAAALERARALAEERGLADQVSFVSEMASEESADRVICVGASHALEGTTGALSTLAKFLRPEGRLLFGDAFWERPPTVSALRLFGSGLLSLAEVADHAVAAGWRILHLSTADQREWDDFESTWRAGRQEWLLANPRHHRAQAVREELDLQLMEYLSVYRGVLGFFYLILSR